MSRRAKLAAAAQRPGLDPLHSVKKGDAAYHAVRRSILLRHTEPGDILLEQRIATQLNCSQGTVREALLRLEQDGLVTRRGYRGTVVSTTSIQEAAQMVQIRVQIECAGVRQSANGLSAETKSELLGITEEMDAAMRDLDFYRCSELDRRFHVTLFRESGLPGLEPILNRCALHMHRITYRNAEAAPPDLSFGDKHRALVRALDARDPLLAAEAIRSHIEAVVDEWAPALGEEVRRIQDRTAIDGGGAPD